MTLLGIVTFENKAAFKRHSSLIEQLAPWDVLIGRDILSHCRFYMDLGRGKIRLYFTPDAEVP